MKRHRCASRQSQVYHDVDTMFAQLVDEFTTSTERCISMILAVEAPSVYNLRARWSWFILGAADTCFVFADIHMVLR